MPPCSPILLGLTLALAAQVPAAESAAIAPATVPLAAGTLSITAPAAADVGVATPGATLQVRFTAVQVTDGRGLAPAVWTASVTTNHFTDPQNSSRRINRNAASYWSGPATATTGVGTFTPGQLTRAQQVNLATTRTAFKLTGGQGNTTARWSPTLVVKIPADALSGRYVGVISHSVV
ncbi:hypothetical protein [Streptomyces sp. NPDC059176]|uniref:hypothetical protein n=1 Tax=unclassified Streptomyces TaxID=2593676 RepID=UPI0036A965B0